MLKGWIASKNGIKDFDFLRKKGVIIYGPFDNENQCFSKCYIKNEDVLQRLIKCWNNRVIWFLEPAWNYKDIIRLSKINDIPPYKTLKQIEDGVIKCPY